MFEVGDLSPVTKDYLQCPTWAISLWIIGEKLNNPVVLEVLIPRHKPICEDCGLGRYSVLVAKGIAGA
jgi:hypothetical protein